MPEEVVLVEHVLPPIINSTDLPAIGLESASFRVAIILVDLPTTAVTFSKTMLDCVGTLFNTNLNSFLPSRFFTSTAVIVIQ